MKLKDTLTGAAMAVTAAIGADTAAAAQPDFGLPSAMTEAIKSYRNTNPDNVGYDQAGCIISAIMAEAAATGKPRGEVLDSIQIGSLRNACAARTGYDAALEEMSPSI